MSDPLHDVLDTPVALFVFNRPETTERVLERIAQQRPRTLLVICDGPRADRVGEQAQVEAVRSLVADRVDWPCDLRTHYSAVNLGCRRRLSSGLDWVFACVQEAIILEDDCVPDPSFFRWCAEMLERHRMHPKVMMVAGTCYVPAGHEPDGGPSYHYSRFSHIWGWATWRRAWAHYDVDLRAWPDLRNGEWLARVAPVPRAARYYRGAFDAVVAGRIDTWDYQWDFAMLVQGGLSVVPQVNLIQNLGVGAGATNTIDCPREALVPCGSLPFPLIHPDTIEADQDRDRLEFAFLRPQPWLRRWRDVCREAFWRWRKVAPRY